MAHDSAIHIYILKNHAKTTSKKIREEEEEGNKLRYCTKMQAPDSDDGLDTDAVELSSASEQSSSTMVSRVARRCRLVQVSRHGATSANWALGDRGELRAVSKKKEANCTPAILSRESYCLSSSDFNSLVDTPQRRQDLYRAEL